MNGDIWKKLGVGLAFGGVIFSAGGAWFSLQQNAQDIRDIKADMRLMRVQLDHLMLEKK